MNSLRDMGKLTAEEKKEFMSQIKKLDGVLKLKKIAKTERVKELLGGYSKTLKSQLVFKK